MKIKILDLIPFLIFRTIKKEPYSIVYNLQVIFENFDFRSLFQYINFICFIIVS